MRHLVLFILILLLPIDAAQKTTTMVVEPAARTTNAVPIGLNLGSWTSWGAEQLSTSVLKNPGWEGTIDRALICVGDGGPDWFLDDTPWTARSAGFWNGASFEVMSGALAGARGNIVRNEVRNGAGWFAADREVGALRPGDIVSITLVNDDDLPAQWWFENASRNRIRPDRSAVRPGSKGVRSLLLSPDDSDSVAGVSYLDAIGDRAGKLLPMNGGWRLSVWAKGTGGDARLHVGLSRSGSPKFWDLSVTPTKGWTHYQWTFSVDDTGPAGTIELRFEASGPGGQIWLDDASLSAVNDRPFPFRRDVVETLRVLRPGYLRDWQGQLGDTWENRIAASHARRESRYRPGDGEADYAYSLSDFLQLCNEVKTRPWIVLPTTMSAVEWRNAGAWLSAMRSRYGFEEVVIEFGNENWNELFRPAGILSPETLAAVSNRAMDLFRSGSGDDPHFRLMVGGNAQNPDFLRRFKQQAQPGFLTSIAPYYLYSYVAGATRSTAVRTMFGDGMPKDRVGTDLAIYEMNAHTLGGDAAVGNVNELVESAESGAALAWHALGWMESGVSRQCIYALAGFDAYRDDSRELVRLFGITRDLASVAKLRPTGEAIALVNRAIAGEFHAVRLTGGDQRIKAVAFRQKGLWSLVVVSSSPEPTSLAVSFPAGEVGMPNRFELLNGTKGVVEISNGNLTLELPAHGVAVVE